MKHTLFLIFCLLLGMSINSGGFAQNCPCVKTKIIGNDTGAGFVHNNNVVAMGDITINKGECIQLYTALCVGKEIWYQKGKEEPLNSSLQKPSVSTTYIVKSLLEGCPEVSDTLNVTVEKSYFSEPRVKENFSISPNPASNELHISGFDATFNKIEIRNISGKILIIRDNLNNLSAYTVDISSLKQGFYMLTIYTSDKNSFTGKIIKK